VVGPASPLWPTWVGSPPDSAFFSCLGKIRWPSVLFRWRYDQIRWWRDDGGDRWWLSGSQVSPMGPGRASDIERRGHMDDAEQPDAGRLRPVSSSCA
jgi:hypothetical protein